MAADDDAKRLKVTEQMAAAVARLNRQLDASVRLLNSQYQIMSQVRDAVAGAAELEDPLKKAKDAKEAIREISEANDKGKDAAAAHGQALKDAMEKSESSAQNFLKAIRKVTHEFPVMKTAALAAGQGVVEGFRAAVAITKSMVGATASLVAGIGRIGIAILAIPFKIFQGLIDKAEAGGGGNELAQAYENVRKQFGDFRQDAAHNVIATARHIDEQFKQTGLNTFRVFGMLANRLELVNKIATAMGATWDVLGKEFEENAGHILAYQKGLGVSEEDMKNFGQAAIAMGKPLQEVMRETASLTLAMQKQFGGSAKLYSRDISKMINDVKHFGGVSQKVMVEVAVYTRKLGIETEKLLGMLDKFDTFDEAAQSAAKLAQTYGAQVDAFKLMTAESPVEQLDMIRKAMFEAGKSAENLDRKDFKYISTITGMDEATVRASLSMKNQGVSLDKIREGSAKAEKQQLSQAEAMQKLAGAIERMVMSGSTQFGGFIKALLKGFNDGIEWSQEFRQTMWNIRQDLRIMYFAGRQLGAEFVKAFPGVKQLLGGIRDLFDPAKFKKLAADVVEVFKQFFTDMTEKPKVAFPLLMKALRERFFNFFNLETGAGSKIVEGFRKFMMALGQIAGGATKFLLESLRDGFKLITDLMSGKGLKEIGGAATGAKKFLIDLFTPIFEALKEVWPSLRDAFVKMITTAWEKIKSSGVIEKLWDFLKKYIVGVGAVTLGAGVVKGSGTLIIGALAKGVGSMVGSALTGLVGNMKKETTKALAQSGVGSIAKDKVAETVKSISPDTAKSMTSTAAELDKGAKSGFNLKSVGLFLLAFAGVVAIGMVALWAAVKIFKGEKLEDIAKGLFVIAGVSAALLPAAAGVALLGKVKVDPTAVLTGLGMVAIAVIAMATTLGLIYAAFSALKVDYTKFGDFTKSIVEMSKVFLVAGLVVGEAMLVGAAITATGGLAGAAAAAGFAAIGFAVLAMSGSVVGIMKSLAGLPSADGMKERVDMFVSILTAVTNFARVFSDILEAVRPSFIQVLKGTDVSEQMDQVTKFVSTLIGSPAGGGIMGLVDQLTRVVKDLATGGESVIRAGEALGNMLGAVAEMAHAMTPPDALFEATGGLFKSSDATGDALSQAANYVRTLESSLQGIVDRVQRFVTEMTGKLGPDQVKSVQAISSVFPAIAQIVTALKPDPSLVSAAKDAEGNIAENVMAHVSDIVIAQGLQVRNAIDGISTSLGPIVEATKGLSAGQIESLKAFTPLLTAVFNLVTGISSAFTGILLSNSLNSVGIEGRVAQVTHMVNTIKDVMKGMGEALPGMIDSLKGAIGNIDVGPIAAFKQKIGIVKDVLDIAAAIPATLKSFGAGDAVQDVQAARLGIVDKLWNVKWLIDDVFGKNGGGPLPGIIGAVNGSVLGNVDQKKIGATKDVVDSTSKIASAISGFPEISEGVGTKVKASLSAIGELLEKTAELNALMHSPEISKIDIAPKLASLANKVGLGGTDKFTIKHEPVTITINLKIEMDAKEIDHALIDRKGTAITFDPDKRKLDV